ncbi:KICSTOR complex protein kaptin-like [Patiria miniata]|uniref:KICSTOR complex protein kaptin n=1 Tax=Patiria miniata TaxID=46514 RepID=A0A914BCM3_PATMI|nr:KICSTOR complex protein kaptin-like [Patiria miniata]
MSLSCCFWEAHFACLSNQSNVYGLTSFRLPDGGSKVLVAPLKDNVLCLEYVKDRGNLKPVARDVQFIYSNPDDAELASISAFTKQPESSGLVVGITFTKDDGSDSPSHYFNIYYPWEKDADFNLDRDSQYYNIEHLLDFIPYYLCHTDIIQDGQRDTVFLLTGGDSKVHLYKEDKESSSRFSEHPIEDLFPEFEDLPSIALWLHCQLLPNDMRLTVVGCQNGYIRLSLVSCHADYAEILKTWEIQHDSAITCVKLFKTHTPVKTPSFLPVGEEKNGDGYDGNGTHSPGEEEWHLLVTSALEVAVVYRNVVCNGLQRQLVLPDSDCYDCTLCACVADVDWDAQNEILIGTYGQELLCYKYFSTGNKKTKMKESEKAEISEGKTKGKESAPETRLEMEDQEGTQEDTMGSTETEGREPDLAECQEDDVDCEGGEDCPGEYRLVWQRSFAHPLIAMKYVDLMSDGLYELILLSLKGVHILQHDLEEATHICEERLGTVPTPSSSSADAR